MTLPNGDKAIIDPAKLVEYCLNESHPTGKHKAKVFKARLGITLLQTHLLQRSIEIAAATHDAVAGNSDFYGQRFVVDFDMTGPAGHRTSTKRLDHPARRRLPSPNELLRL